MELEIETGNLSTLLSSTKSGALDDIINKKSNILNDYIAKVKNVDRLLYADTEYISVKVKQLFCINSSYVVFGELLEDNQNRFELNVKRDVFVVLKNSSQLANLVTKISQQSNITEKERAKFYNVRDSRGYYFMDICTEDNFVFPIPNIMSHLSENETIEMLEKSGESTHAQDRIIGQSNIISFSERVQVIALFLSSLTFFHITFYSTIKFNSNDAVLLISNSKADLVLMTKILQTIGYKVVIYNEKEVVKSTEELIIDRESRSVSDVRLVTMGEIARKNEFFDVVFDFSNEFYKNKVDYLSFCNFGAFIVLNSTNTISNTAQLDPQDLEILYEKNISLKLANSSNFFKFNKHTGRTLNFINEFLESTKENIDPIRLVNRLALKKIEFSDFVNSRKSFEEICGVSLGTTGTNESISCAIEFTLPH